MQKLYLVDLVHTTVPVSFHLQRGFAFLSDVVCLNIWSNMVRNLLIWDKSREQELTPPEVVSER